MLCGTSPQPNRTFGKLPSDVGRPAGNDIGDGQNISLKSGITSNAAHPKRRPIDVVIVALPFTGIANLFGPAEVFAQANILLREQLYQVRIISSAAHQYKTAFQATLTLDATIKDFEQDADIFLIGGGATWQVPVRKAENAELTEWLTAKCARARRYGAFSSGSFLLAEAGLLHHKHATTHWSRIEEMATRYPDVR